MLHGPHAQLHEGVQLRSSFGFRRQRRQRLVILHKKNVWGKVGVLGVRFVHKNNIIHRNIAKAYLFESWCFFFLGLFLGLSKLSKKTLPVNKTTTFPLHPLAAVRLDLASCDTRRSARRRCQRIKRRSPSDASKNKHVRKSPRK